MKIRLLLVDDHAVVRTGLRMLLEGEEDIEIVGEAQNASETLNQISLLDPDVILMDIGLPDMSGIEATRKIKQLAPDIAIVALTIHEDEEYFFQMLDAGASGYVPKRAAPEELITAIRVTAQGEVYLYPSLAKLLVSDYLTQSNLPGKQATLDGLTPREYEVLTLLADGASNNEIAAQLSISPKTVKTHVSHILDKLNVADRTQAAIYALKNGLE